LVAGLILAAGAGTRFGESSKLVADLEGRPLLEWSVATACSVTELERVVVVLGARSELVLKRVEFGRAAPIICQDWVAGQAASVRHGLAALAGSERVLVTLGDQPLLPATAIRRMLAEPDGARAVYGGRPGHPVVLGRAQIAALADLSGDRGARDVVRGGPEIELGHLWSGGDVDTPEDLEAIRNEARAVI
jgi:molybdenum cofactor cytidylyltransferase